MANSYDFDAIVIGSGISGGWAAKELTEKGLKVLMLDRGRPLERGQYPYEGRGPWQLPYRGSMPPAEMLHDFPSLGLGIADMDQASKSYFATDAEQPYQSEEGKPFRWVRPSIMGGRSITWGRVSLRWSEQDFEANKQDGHGNDWPIRYADLAPWYSHVERFAGIAGSQENLAELPDGEFQPAHPMNAAESWFKERLERRFPGRKVIPTRTCNMTQDKPEQGRAKCQYRWQCSRGCSFGAYFSTQASTLPAAQATDNLTVLTNRVVSRLDYDAHGKRVSGVRAINTQTGLEEVYTGRIVFLCASAMASVRILLNSRTEGSDRSFADASGTLGRYVMDHVKAGMVRGDVPGMEELIEYGRKPNGVYIPRFRNLGDGDDGLGFRRGYAVQSWGARQMSEAKGFGVDMKHGLRKYGPWWIGGMLFGECLPYHDNKVTLHPDKHDPHGIPQLLFDVTFRENEQRLVEDATAESQRMFREAGLSNVQHFGSMSEPGSAIHEMGGARMGNDPRDSVLNKWSQAHDASNLFVTDGAQMASGSCVNPSLTYMALTARAADAAVNMLKSGAL